MYNVCILRSNDRSFMIILCTVRLCESNRKYNPYFSISLSSGRFHACHLKSMGEGGSAGLNDMSRQSGVCGLDLAPG